jgi:hypothetical protein
MAISGVTAISPQRQYVYTSGLTAITGCLVVQSELNSAKTPAGANGIINHFAFIFPELLKEVIRQCTSLSTASIPRARHSIDPAKFRHNYQVA